MFSKKINTILWHALIWVLFFIYLLREIIHVYTFSHALLDSFTYLIINMVLVYIAYFVFFNLFLAKKKWISFLSYLVFICLGTLLKIVVTTTLVIDPIETSYDYGYYVPMHFFTTLFEVTSLSVILYTSRIINHQKRTQEIENQRLKNELMLLKTQISPHFLFNTLNNICVLIRKDQDAAENTIHKLSELLSFILYDAQQETIDIQSELKIIDGLIELEKIRLEKNTLIQFEKNILVNNYLEPLTLLIFVENAFKHSVGSNPHFIKIKVDSDQEKILFQCSNSKPLNGPKPATTGGLGINNITKRLALAYDNNYTLNIEETTTEYSVTLYIYTHKNLKHENI